MCCPYYVYTLLEPFSLPNCDVHDDTYVFVYIPPLCIYMFGISYIHHLRKCTLVFFPVLLVSFMTLPQHTSVSWCWFKSIGGSIRRLIRCRAWRGMSGCCNGCTQGRKSEESGWNQSINGTYERRAGSFHEVNNSGAAQEVTQSDDAHFIP